MFMLVSWEGKQVVATQMEGRKRLCEPGKYHGGWISSLLQFPHSDDFFSVIVLSDIYP